MQKAKVLYIVGWLTLFFGVWNLNPFGSMSKDYMLILQILYLVYGYRHFSNDQFSLLDKKLTLFWWICIGIVLSMIPALLCHNQSFIQSIISYRFQYLWICVPVILKISPSIKELKTSLYIVLILMLLIVALRLLYPSLFTLTDKTLMSIYIDRSNMFMTDGYQLPVVLIMYYLCKFRYEFNIRDFFIVLVLFAYIFIVENRSTLFPVAFIIFISIFGVNSSNKSILVILMLLVCLYIAHDSYDKWVQLYEKTSSQLNNSDYNRVKAFEYYLSPAANKGIITYLLGNGFLSAHASSEMGDLMSYGIYNSDMGLLGFWNQFGLIPVIVFLYMFTNPMIHFRSSSYMVRCMCFFYLITSLTTAYFGLTCHLPLFAIFYYLFYSQDKIEESFRRNNDEY